MPRTKRAMGGGLILAMLLSGCGASDSEQDADLDLPFRARLVKDDAPRAFTVTARADGAGLEEARESARFPATRHCIETHGFSQVDWDIDPATGDWAHTRTADGDLIVSGRCARR